jgi:putative DNA primase/helicase
MKPVELILERAEGVRRVGSGWMVSCPLPGHGRGFGDRNPNVSITEGDDSRALVNCQAGCQTEDIVAEWGLNMSDLASEKGARPGAPDAAKESDNGCDAARIVPR